MSYVAISSLRITNKLKHTGDKRVLYLNHRYKSIKTIALYLLIILLSTSLISCAEPSSTSEVSNTEELTQVALRTKLSEVAPPLVIQELRRSFEPYQPQVKIINPLPDQTIQDTTVNIQLEVQDLPLFKDPQLNLGPNLQVILDNQTPQTIYDLNQPLTLEKLSPGSHTLRVFATRPWFESFKNEGAYAQTTFHIFTKTAQDIPDPHQPLLTYNRPQENYGSEPIMLDFYLANAPLHLVAQQDPEDNISDWRIRVTINGQTFLLDTWDPIYLKGFEPGKNWIKLEYIDEQGNRVDNVFNNTVKLIEYLPNTSDPLTDLFSGKVSREEAKALVDPNYRAKLTPKVTEEPKQTTPEETNDSEPQIPETLQEDAESKPTETLESQNPVVIPIPSESENPSDTNPVVIPIPSESENPPDTNPVVIPIPSESENQPDTNPVVIPIPSESKTLEAQPKLSENQETEEQVPQPVIVVPQKEEKSEKKIFPKEGLLNFWRRSKTTTVEPPVATEKKETPVFVPQEQAQLKTSPEITPEKALTPKEIPPVIVLPQPEKVILTPPLPSIEIQPEPEIPQDIPVVLIPTKEIPQDIPVAPILPKEIPQDIPVAPIAPDQVVVTPQLPSLETQPQPEKEIPKDQTIVPIPPVVIEPVPPAPMLKKPETSFCLKTRESFIAPGTLVGLAYQGLFQTQGIPAGENLTQAYTDEKITAQNIVEAAITDCLLDKKYDLVNNSGYLKEIEQELEFLNKA